MTKIFNKRTKGISYTNILLLTSFFVIVVSFVFILISYLVSLYNLYFLNSSNIVSEISSNKKVISLNIPITIQKGDTAYIVGTTDVLTITGFINSPCPANAQCIWSGLAVLYDLNINGVVLHGTSEKNISSNPYIISIVDSDYVSYAKVIITKLEN